MQHLWKCKTEQKVSINTVLQLQGSAMLAKLAPAANGVVTAAEGMCIQQLKQYTKRPEDSVNSVLHLQGSASGGAAACLQRA